MSRRFSWGKQVEKICQYKKSWSSLSILDNGKRRTAFFILEDDNGKFWVKSSGRCYFSECSSDCRFVLTESNNDVKLVET